VFATEYSQPLEDLITVRSSARIGTHELVQVETDKQFYEGLCELTHILITEFNLDDESKFAPYLNYLLGQERGQLPATWTEAGKETNVSMNLSAVQIAVK
jgi:hypothetical protein